VLQHGQAHQSLDTGHISPGCIQGVLVIQGNLSRVVRLIGAHAAYLRIFSQFGSVSQKMLCILDP
jgi:hypothetical protein